MNSTSYFTLEWESRRRRYLVHVPPAHDGRTPLPVVMFLHGAGGTADWTLGETAWDVTADRRGFLLVLPEAERPDPQQPSGFLNNPQVWNDGSPQQYPDRPTVDDVGFLTAVLDDLPRNFAVDATRVLVSGFSNGAGMAFRLAAERPERLTALAPVAGHCWQPEPRLRVPLPTLYLVGTADPLIPLAGGTIVSPWGGVVVKPSVRATLDKWATANGLDPASVAETEQDGVRQLRYGGERVELLA